MAEINFYIQTAGDFNLMGAGSGLGFFGDGGFNASVAVGEYQGRTYVTDANGVIEGPEANNVKYTHPSTGVLGQAGSGIGLRLIPNYQSTVEVRFTHGTAVKAQNGKVYIYDRVAIANAASGVTTQLAEIIHPGLTQDNSGSGDATWTQFDDTTAGEYLSLCPNPGLSGLYAGDGSSSVHTDTRHSWYLAISASPDSIGSKDKFGLWTQVEYL